MHSLRIKITAVIIAAILASLIAFAFAGFITVGQEASANSAEKMQLQCDIVQQSLDGYLDAIEQSVEMTAYIASGSLDGVTLVECGANKEPGERTADQTKRLDAYLKEHCSHAQQAFGSVASHTNGVITYYYCINPDISTEEHGFFYSKLGKVGFEEQPPIDARELDPDDLEHTTWYYTPIERGVPSWVGPHKAHFLGEVITESYLTPIYKSGMLIGVLGMDILFDEIVGRIDSLDAYETGYACVLDEDGLVLYHPTLEMGSVPEFESQVFREGDLQETNSGGRIIRYEHEGELWQLSFSTLRNGMKLVVCAPVQEVLASWHHLTMAIPIIALIILALFTSSTPFVTRAITRSLQQLTAAAQKLSTGDYNIELDYRGEDEVGRLTDAFRHLRDHLQVYIIDLDSPTYSDPLTGVKNQSAYDIYATRMNDAIGRSETRGELEFSLITLRCNKLAHINATYGQGAGDAHLQATCRLICTVWSRSPVFRMRGNNFVVLLQGRDFQNRDELMLDFEIRCSMLDYDAEEPWLCVDTTQGMATFRPDEDKNIEDVMQRADRRLREAAQSPA